MVNEYENTLRRLVLQIIGDNDSSPYKVTEDRILKWKEKRETEAKKNNGILFEKRLLYYSDFYDLKTIITKNWELFLLILNDKKRFEVFFSEIESFRNTIAHGRIINFSQEFLLKGILSDLKNSITIYHNKNEMKDDYFVEIIRISDNLGNIWDSNSRPQQPILRVGDQYELVVEANDPLARKIEYELSNKFCDFKIIQDSNRFIFTIENKFVNKSSWFLIMVSTPDSEYENYALKSIDLTVLPQKR